jgi:hypothetical protein
MPTDPDDPLPDASCRGIAADGLHRGSEAHTQELIRRFDRAPKPMAYQPDFLDAVWARYLSENACAEEEVDPDAFIRWTYAQALAHRQPRYEAMAPWGVSVTADEIAARSATPPISTR